jgi:hypothetical protein
MNLYILIIVIIIFKITHPNYETCDYNATFYTTFFVHYNVKTFM